MALGSSRANSPHFGINIAQHGWFEEGLPQSSDEKAHENQTGDHRQPKHAHHDLEHGERERSPPTQSQIRVELF